ncbi:DUF1631 family protein [Cognatiluteimonas profundi]|uniref:DUF1631 family protein n=1 Tax=Cognatiluteimonas profundi TaxID=2594501 RepID=UPI00131B1AF3|nr:DUF1631 family protein [Lysobacter profundi]
MKPGASQLFAEMQKATIERLGAAMEVVMRQADDYLFDRTTQAAEGAELTALRDLRRARAQLRQTFEASVVAAFQRLQGGPLSADPVKRELFLLSEDALEEQLASEQMLDNLLRRHAPALDMLDQRIAVLADRSVLAAGENPAGPASIAQALRDALGAVELSTSLRIALYKFMERELATALTPLYDQINARLGDAGILPRLLPPAPVESNVARPDAQATRSDGDIAAAAETPTDHALFSSLIGMLQSWRQHMMPAGADIRQPSAQLGVPQLMSALSLLQSEPQGMLDQAVGDARLSLADLLRKEVLAGARRLGMGGEDLNLSAVQEDAVDLVGMLFDVLLDERDFQPDVRRKIGRMLVPYVKVAVTDRRMFVYKGHPARRFLNAVAEACEGNHGDVPQERELLDHVNASIDRLVAEFAEDVAIFETLEQELRSFMTQHRQRIEIAERRAAETQRGRERLAASRERAAADVCSHRGARELPPMLNDLLSGYATHHLTQLGLRGGPESDPYVRSIGTIDGLMATFDAASSQVPVAELPALDRTGLTQMLASSGCVGTAADEAIDTIHRSLCQIADVATGDVEPAQLPMPAPIIPRAEVAPPVLAVVGGHASLDFDPEMAERMRALEIGTWLQLTGESGRTEPAKVSWVSPISSRFLFVNRRGARVLVASAEELAAMEKIGRVQLRPAGSAFDDALQQMMGRMQNKIAA